MVRSQPANHSTWASLGTGCRSAACKLQAGQVWQVQEFWSSSAGKLALTNMLHDIPSDVAFVALSRAVFDGVCNPFPLTLIKRPPPKQTQDVLLL